MGEEQSSGTKNGKQPNREKETGENSDKFNKRLQMLKREIQNAQLDKFKGSKAKGVKKGKPRNIRALIKNSKYKLKKHTNVSKKQRKKVRLKNKTQSQFKEKKQLFRKINYFMNKSKQKAQAYHDKPVKRHKNHHKSFYQQEKPLINNSIDKYFKTKKKLLFCADVNFQNQSQKINIYEGDNIEQVAIDFLQKYKISIKEFD